MKKTTQIDNSNTDVCLICLGESGLPAKYVFNCGGKCENKKKYNEICEDCIKEVKKNNLNNCMICNDNKIKTNLCVTGRKYYNLHETKKEYVNHIVSNIKKNFVCKKKQKTKVAPQTNQIELEEFNFSYETNREEHDDLQASICITLNTGFYIIFMYLVLGYIFSFICGVDIYNKGLGYCIPCSIISILGPIPIIINIVFLVMLPLVSRETCYQVIKKKYDAAFRIFGSIAVSILVTLALSINANNCHFEAIILIVFPIVAIISCYCHMNYCGYHPELFR